MGMGLALPDDVTAPVSLLNLFLHPRGPVFWLMAVTIWASALAYLARAFGVLIRQPRPEDLISPEDREWENAIRAVTPFSEQNTADLPVADRGSVFETLVLSLGLGIAALWPWVIEQDLVLGFLLSAAMLVAILSAALARGSGATRYRTSTTLGVLAGWAVVVTCAAFATLLEQNLGTSPTLSALVALLICSIAAANIQLHLGSPFGFSLTVMWGLFGIALATMAADAAIATATVLAMAFVGVALVRVST